MAEKIITFENICYSFPNGKKPALKDINLSVMQGEFLAVMGETGAGKTTFCKLINGLIPHSCGGRLSGTVTVDGCRTDKSSVQRLALKVGMVLDEPDAQLFTSSVRHEAAFGPENLLLPPQEIEERVAEALAAVGLTGFEHRQPATLSGGEKQRLAIAASLAMKGKILVLDEPLCRLDPDGAEEVMSVLKDIRSRYGITVIMACNDSAGMYKYADRVCILRNGSIAACAEAKEIIANRSLLEENGIQPPSDADIFKVFSVKTEELPENKTPAIQLKNFTFSYGENNPSIKNINLFIADNDFAAIIGHNGCGKTTLLKCITGLLHPAPKNLGAGDIYIRGKNTKELSVSDISKEAGFVMQNPDNQLFTESVYSEIVFALKNAGLSKEEIRRRAEDALYAAGLEYRDAFPHALSRADRTKTVIACVLAMGCRIILFDETDIGQDYRGCVKIMDIARELHQKGYTIVFVTHNMSLVCEYARRLIVMDRNGIVMDNTKA